MIDFWSILAIALAAGAAALIARRRAGLRGAQRAESNRG